MKNKITQNELTSIRRKDRSKGDPWIKSFINSTPFVTIATSIDNQPFQHINTFVYDETNHAIYIHTAKNGRLIENIKKNNLVSIAFGSIGRMLPSKTAMHFSCEYESVIAIGKVTIISNQAKSQLALQLLLERYFPNHKAGKDYHEITDEEINLTAVYEINIDSWSGKKKEVDKDSPGAFEYGE